MKNKKLVAILTLLCFLFTLMPTMALAAAPSELTGTYEVTDNETATGDITISGDATITIAADKTLDMDGHKITVTDGASLIISGDGTIMSTSTVIRVDAGGTVTLNGCTVTVDDIFRTIDNHGGTVNVNGGTVRNTKNGHAIDNTYGAITNISGNSTVSALGDATISVDEAATLNITGAPTITAGTNKAHVWLGYNTNKNTLGKLDLTNYTGETTFTVDIGNYPAAEAQGNTVVIGKNNPAKFTLTDTTNYTLTASGNNLVLNAITKDFASALSAGGETNLTSGVYVLNNNIGGETVKGNINIPVADVRNGHYVTIDLNGKTLDLGAYQFNVAAKSTLIIKDSSTGGTLTSTADYVIKGAENVYNDISKVIVKSGNVGSIYVGSYGEGIVESGTVSSIYVADRGELILSGAPVINGIVVLYLNQWMYDTIVTDKGYTGSSQIKLQLEGNGWTEYNKNDVVIGGTLENYTLATPITNYELVEETDKLILKEIIIPHSHTYNKEETTTEHLAKAANCQTAAIYYKSCECGQNGIEIFTSGGFDSATHTSSEFKYTPNNNGTHLKENACCNADVAAAEACNYGIDGICTLCGYKKTPTPDTTPSANSGGFSGNYNYPVNTGEVEGADVAFSENYAVVGDTVTITVTPEAGKQVDEVIITDEDGNVITATKVGENKYSFTMPEGKVNVEVKTKAAEADKEIVLQINNKNVVVDGKTIKNDVVPVLKDGRTLVPLRVILTALGGEVDWDGATRTVTIEIDGKVLKLVIDAHIPGFGQGATIMDNRTYVPIRYVAQYIGADVEWNAATQQIFILK